MTEQVNNTPISPGPVQVPVRTQVSWGWIISCLIVGIVLGCGVGFVLEQPREVRVNATAQGVAQLEQTRRELEQRQLDLDAWESRLQVREDELAVIEGEISRNTITDGIWTVGVDIPAGTYRAVEVGEFCYWAILVTGTNGDDIVTNGLPGGGNPTVTLEEGHDFETARCGEWRPQ